MKEKARFGVIIPACDEEESIGLVLRELLRVLDPDKFIVAVGVNGSSDRTAQMAREHAVLVAETSARGYGHGCRAAIDLTTAMFPPVRGYIFFAADGASNPRDVVRLAQRFEEGWDFILGARTTRLANWRVMGLSHVIANFLLGLWSGWLGGRWFVDLGPLRLIERELFDALALREMTYGWTIEAQTGAARLGARICEVSVKERRRRAGRQKVSGVTWRQTFLIGCRIVAAGWRTRRRFRDRSARAEARPMRKLAPQV
jgi:glycosyltransferase involved in cell wall biosynthesis